MLSSATEQPCSLLVLLSPHHQAALFLLLLSNSCVGSELGVGRAFTLESSLGGCSSGALAGCHFQTGDYQKAGERLCEAIWRTLGPDPK